VEKGIPFSARGEARTFLGSEEREVCALLMTGKDNDVLRRDGRDEGPVGHQTVAVVVIPGRVGVVPASPSKYSNRALRRTLQASQPL